MQTIDTSALNVRSGRGVRPFSDAAKAALKDQMNRAVAAGDAPAIVEVVVDPDGVLYESACGLPVDAIFYVASMTKPITSVAIMMLAERGWLAIDDPVSKYLDGFDRPQVISRFDEADGTYDTRPAARAITIRHLLSHTSGLGYGWSDPIECALTAKTTKHEWELPLLHDPGTRFTYSPSPRLLGFIVERLTGCPLEAWYREHIFEPLGMRDTSFVVPIGKLSRVAPRFTRKADGIEPLASVPASMSSLPPVRGDGGLHSTAGDYGRFVRMLLNGGVLDDRRILDESSVNLMSQNAIGDAFLELQPNADPELTRPFPIGAGKDRFGLGFQIAGDDPARKGFRSPGSIGWGGLYNTEFWADPASRIGGVHMMQLLPFCDEGAIRAFRGFEHAVYQSLRRERSSRASA